MPVVRSRSLSCELMEEVTGTSVSVAYHNSQNDLRAATLLAARVLPGLVRIQRAARFSLAAAIVLGVVYSLRLMAGSSVSPLMFGALFGITAVGVAFSFPRFLALLSARNPISRRTLGEATFAASPSGISTSVSGTSGTFTWQAIDRVAEGGSAVIFTIGPQLFCFVPARVLSDAERAVIRRLAAGAGDGPEWLDLRGPKV
jgi:hypothetical protein